MGMKNIATRIAVTSPVNISLQVLAYDSVSHELTFGSRNNSLRIY